MGQRASTTDCFNAASLLASAFFFCAVIRVPRPMARFAFKDELLQIAHALR